MLGSFLMYRGRVKGFSLVVFGIMLSFSITFPPYQAADEPQHLISYIDLTGQKELLQNLENYSKKAHFKRIVFKEKEKFTSLDVKNQSDEKFEMRFENTENPTNHIRVVERTNAADDSIYSSKTEHRSLTTPIAWKASSIFLKNTELINQMLILRIINSCLFSLVVFAILTKQNYYFMLLLLSIPTIFCISISISNYVFSICILLVIFSLILRYFSNNEKENSLLYYLTFSGICSLLVFESISYIFIIPVLLLLLNISQKRNNSFIYFILFTSFFYILFSDLFLFKLQTYIPNSFNRYVIFMSLSLLCAAFVILYFKFNLLDFKNKLNIRIYHFMIISLIISFIFSNIQSTDIENDETSYLAFIFNFFLVLITWFRVGSPDFFSQQTLFAGFGWLDLYPFKLVVFINFYIFFILPFVRKNEAVEVKKKSVLLFYFFLFTSIICLMTSLYLPGFNPHGRYYLAYFMTLLLGGYLLHNRIEGRDFITGFIIKNIKYITYIAFFVIYISSINLLFLRYY